MNSSNFQWWRFNPLSIPGCVAWFDMMDPNAYTDASGFVSDVINKASGVTWSEATDRPAFAATGFNGLPCMDFDGSNDKILSTEAAVFGGLDDSTANTVFLAAQSNTLAATKVAFALGNSTQPANAIRRWGQSSSGGGKWQQAAVNDAGGLSNAVSAAANNSNPNVHQWYSTTTVTSLSLNGATDDPSSVAFAPGTLTPDRSAIGCQPASTLVNFWDGPIGEIVIYSADLTAAQRARVRVYLELKWRISGS